MITIQSNKGPLILEADFEEEENFIQMELLSKFTSLNVQQIQDEHFKIFLSRLGYQLNQGWRFVEEEKKQSFFEMTKLLSCIKPQIRRLLFKILLMINVREFIYMIIQSLVNDLSSNNQYLKSNAFQNIPQLDDEIYILQVDKYIRNALLDNNEYISNHAMIVELRLIKRFPQLVNRYSGIIIEKLSNCFFINKQHALNLIHEIKKTDINSFIKIIISLKRQESTPLVKIQMIRYIGEILIQNDVCLSLHRLELEQYLLSQMYHQEPTVFLEAAKSVIKISSISNQQLKRLIKFILNQLVSISNIEAFAALKLIQQLLKNTERRKLIRRKHLRKIKKLTFSSHVSVSSQAILICIQQQKDQDVVSQYLQKIYSIQQLQEQVNFLYGMLEFVSTYEKYGEEIIKFLQLIIPQNCTYQMAKIAFQITEQILIIQFLCLVPAMRTLFWIAHSFDKKHKLKTIKLILKHWLSRTYQRIKGKSTQRQFDELQQYLFDDFSQTLKDLNVKPLIIDRQETDTDKN